MCLLVQRGRRAPLVPFPCSYSQAWQSSLGPRVVGHWGRCQVPIHLVQLPEDTVCQWLPKAAARSAGSYEGFRFPPPPPPPCSSVAAVERVHMGCRTKDVSKHLRCHQESSPRGLGLPPRCLPCFQAPCLCLLTSQKSLCASVMPVLHQRLTHTCFGCTLARAARLSSPKLLLIVAPVQRGCKG